MRFFASALLALLGAGCVAADDPSPPPSAEPAPCTTHQDCLDLIEGPVDICTMEVFCYADVGCSRCEEAHYCSDGIDGTVGCCNSSVYPLYESGGPGSCSSCSPDFTGGGCDNTGDDGPPLCAQDCEVTEDGCALQDVSCLADCAPELLAEACMACAGSPAFDAMCKYAPGGFCFSGSSSVSVLVKGSSLRAPKTETKLISGLKVGDKVLAAGAPVQAGRPFSAERTFAAVTGVHHSPSKENFVEIVMSKNKGHNLRATLYHTFITCGGKEKFAKDLKHSDCLHTDETKITDTVHSATILPPSDGEKTYTIDLEDGMEEIAVGGVFSHARSLAKLQLKSEKAKPKFKKMLVEAGLKSARLGKEATK